MREIPGYEAFVVIRSTDGVCPRSRALAGPTLAKEPRKESLHWFDPKDADANDVEVQTDAGSKQSRISNQPALGKKI